MASTQSLSASAQDRKSRLAQLKSLKRKNTEDHEDANSTVEPVPIRASTASDEVKSKYLSGRNYDLETKTAKLGFDTAPTQGQETLEQRAEALAEATKTEAQQVIKIDQPLDLFTIQPKKPNWDLKRDLDKKLEILNVRTNNAIARIVRERIAKQNSGSTSIHARRAGEGNGEEGPGLDGTSLVEATNLREREDEEEALREREQEDDSEGLDAERHGS